MRNYEDERSITLDTNDKYAFIAKEFSAYYKLLKRELLDRTDESIQIVNAFESFENKLKVFNDEVVAINNSVLSQLNTKIEKTHDETKNLDQLTLSGLEEYLEKFKEYHYLDWILKKNYFIDKNGLNIDFIYFSNLALLNVQLLYGWGSETFVMIENVYINRFIEIIEGFNNLIINAISNNISIKTTEDYTLILKLYSRFRKLEEIFHDDHGFDTGYKKLTNHKWFGMPDVDNLVDKAPF